MKNVPAVILLLALTTGFASAAVTITFDDLPTPALGGTVLLNGYGGLRWANVAYLDSANNDLGAFGSGYNNAVVSSPNVAFMAFDGVTQSVLVSGPTFDFNSVWLTAAWYDGLNIRVRGYSGGTNGTVLYDRTVIVNTSGPTFFNFNYLGIDTLRFETSGGTPSIYGDHGRHFVIDDMTITPKPNPLNHPPTAQNLAVIAAANADTPIALAGADVDGTPLAYSFSAPSRGTLSGTPPNLIYTPSANYLGVDSFIYFVGDPSGAWSSSARVSISVKHGLWINNISLNEGNSGTRAATFTVNMTVPGNEFDVVSVGFRTSDGTAKAGSDYVATSGTISFAPEALSQVITVPVIGDTVVEFNETFLVQLSNPSLNAVIVNGTGRCTIVNDDSAAVSRVGTAALSPENSVVDVGESLKLSLTWTHPVGWRHLDSVDLLLVDEEGEALAVRWHAAENSFSLLSAAADKFVRTAEAGSPARFETSAATLFLQDCTGGGPPGQTATIDLSLSFKPQAAGRTFSVEAFATDNTGVQQGFESVGTITVLPR
jgi:hypothetical protein